MRNCFRRCVPLILLLFVGCTSSGTNSSTTPASTETIPEGYNFPHPKNVAEPSVHGLWVVRSGSSLCLKCHKGNDAELPGPKCTSCHALYPHAAGWVAKESHGKHVIEKGQTVCATQCHGTDLAGGLSGVSCTKCHTTYPHVTGWKEPKSHGASALGDKKNICKLCHGDSFGGGQSQTACSDCHVTYPHATGWLAGGTSAHGPVVKVEGSTQCQACHGTNLTGSIFSTFCSDCHKKHESKPKACKSCHEAGTGLTHTRPQDGIHPATQDCVACHDYATGDFKILKGETIDFTQSRHGDSTATINAFAKESNIANCMRCHTSVGFKDYIHDDIQGAALLASKTTPDPLTCTSCHNADTANYATTGTTIITTSNKTLSLHMEGLCVRCHSGRSGEGSLKVAAAISGKAEDTVLSGTYTYAQYPGNTAAAGTVSGSTNRNAAITTHYFPVANIFYGSDAGVGYEYSGKSYVGKNTLMPGYGTCITCHNPHTAKVQAAKCVACHTGATTTDAFLNIRVTTSDYDGDGNTTEGTSYEITGVMAKLLQAIQNYALNVPPSATGIQFSNGSWTKVPTGTFAQWTPRLLKAAFNYQLVFRDANAFVHNSKYTVQLLYDAIEDLNAGMDATGHAANKVDMTGMVRP